MIKFYFHVICYVICYDFNSFSDVYGLECYFGLGNTSVRNKQKTTQCPGDYMVCKKMYGGGMGDQIRRYCDEMESDVIIFNFSIDFGNDDITLNLLLV